MFEALMDSSSSLLILIVLLPGLLCVLNWCSSHLWFLLLFQSLETNNVIKEVIITQFYFFSSSVWYLYTQLFNLYGKNGSIYGGHTHANTDTHTHTHGSRSPASNYSLPTLSATHLSNLVLPSPSKAMGPVTCQGTHLLLREPPLQTHGFLSSLSQFLCVSSFSRKVFPALCCLHLHPPPLSLCTEAFSALFSSFSEVWGRRRDEYIYSIYVVYFIFSSSS